MRTLSPALLCLAVAAQLAAQDPNAARVDRDALLRHYAAVEAELRAVPAPGDAAVAARRTFVIDALRDYRARGDFGIGEANGSRMPLFVDADGRRCAVAWMLDRTGHGDLTLAIQRQCNGAWVAELAGDPALQRWLTAHGLSADEAVRIQAPYQQNEIEPPPPAEPEGPPPERQPNGDVTTQPPTPPGTAPSGGRPATTPPTTPRVPGQATGGARGITVDALEAASWLDWWEWNRGVFEPPQRAATIAVTGTVPAQHAEAVTLLTTLSASPDANVRAAAVQALGRMGAVPDQLTKHLDDSARSVRLAALLGLGSAGTAAHAHALATRLAAPQQGETIAVALAGMAVVEEGPGQRALAATMSSLLTDRRPSVQAAAALAAGSTDDDTMRNAARDALAAATTPAERAAALSLLGPRADADDVARLTALANDRSVDVRRSASLALGRSKHRLALPALQSAFEYEHEMTTRALQLLAIGDHGGDAGRAFLLGEIDAGAKALRGFAALALGLWGHGRDAGDAGECITTALAAERNRDQRGAYLLALGLLRDAASRDLLARELRDGSTSPTRGAAAAALGLLGDRAALPALQKAAEGDNCPWVRQQAARAMGALGSGATVALIAMLKNDKNASVQSSVALTLGGLTDGRAAGALLAFAADESVPAEARAAAALGLGRHFRAHEPRLPELRFQQNHLLLPAITAWAFSQEL